MIEVAIASMQEALAANGEAAPAGSYDPPRRNCGSRATAALEPEPASTVTEADPAPDRLSR